MGLVRAWRRQVARAAGASLIAPLMLLLGAGIVASGGGLDGIASLGQIASGPSLPDTGLGTATSSSLEEAEIVGAELPTPAVEPAQSAAATGDLASSSPRSAPATPAAGLAPRVRAAPPATNPPASQEPPLTDTGRPERSPSGPSQDVNPVDDIEDTTRGLGESLPVPLRPLAESLIDLLLGPPPG